MTTTTPAVQVSGVRRSYGAGATAFEAVRGVDLVVEPGSIVALLGTNGAGKTSLLEVVEGLAPATGGTVRVCGLDPVADRSEVRRRTGVLLQESGFSGDLTVRETLQMWAATLTAPDDVDDTLALLDLQARAGVRVRALSGGERRRLDLACALLGDPDLLLLDEPTTGLDPESRRGVWGLISGLRERGASVLLTTHYLEEAHALADRIVILHDGRVVREGTPAGLVSGFPSSIRFETPALPLPPLPGTTARVEGTTTVLACDDLQDSLTALLQWAATHQVRLSGLTASTADLETVFLAAAAS